MAAAMHRPKDAAKGALASVVEALRCGVLSAGFGAAGVLSLRRELFVVAQRRPGVSTAQLLG